MMLTFVTTCTRGAWDECIDGSVAGKRQAAIDRFSDPKSDSFIMLLTTKAGGVGINLVAADNVLSSTRTGTRRTTFKLWHVVTALASGSRSKCTDC